LALSRDRKNELVKVYGERLQKAQVALWAQYRGIPVGQLNLLRRQVREAGAEAMVVKNTLMRIALEKAGFPTPPELLTGPYLVTFIYDDIAPAARALATFARENQELFQLVGGLINGQVVGKDQIQMLTTLPSREELLAKVVGGIQAPLYGLAGTLAAIMRSFLYVLNARAQQLEEAA